MVWCMFWLWIMIIILVVLDGVFISYVLLVLRGYGLGYLGDVIVLFVFFVNDFMLKN